MESSSSSSSFKHLREECLIEKHKCMAARLVSNCLIVLPLSIPQFIHDPFGPSAALSRQPICSSSNPNLQSLVTTTTTHILHNFQSSIVSAADRCIRIIRLFHLFASYNPFMSKVFSPSSDLQNFPAANADASSNTSQCLAFLEIHRRNYMKLNSLPNHNFAAILPGDSVTGIVVANGILNFLNIYNTLLVCRLVLTWFPNSPPAIVSPLSTLCDPYLNIFRGLIPPLGGTLDLSPILAFLVLNAFTSTASALPAELPSVGVSQGNPSSRVELSDLTTSQKKWMRRFAANRSNSSSSDN